MSADGVTAGQVHGRWIYDFDDMTLDTSERSACLGLKGAGLAEMTLLGLPVPAGFTIATPACATFHETDGQWPDGLSQEVAAALPRLEERAGKRFGDSTDPLLVAVRSGAPVAMPGMMDTVLNLGLNDITVDALARRTGSAVFAWDSYRRFIQMFGDVVLGIHYTRFSRVEEQFRRENEGATSAEALQALCGVLKDLVEEHGQVFPMDPAEQLKHAVSAVFKSYNSHRARYFRRSNDIAEDIGTAVTIQAMVFGNRGEDSGTGVASTRNPKTGERGLYGDWLFNAQGHDVVAGSVSSSPLSASDSVGQRAEQASLEVTLPDVHRQLAEVAQILERQFRDMQDIEFTVECGALHVLQTSCGKRGALAAVQIVVDLVNEGTLDQKTALERIDPGSLEVVLRPVIAPNAMGKQIARGLDASPGAATGKVVFEASDCQDYLDRDEPTILVRVETSPEDIQGVTVAQGVVTTRGGQTSHAAVVARGMGKPCVVGCTDIQVDYSRELFYAGDAVIRKGDWITIDGGTGEVMQGRVEMIAPATDSGAMATLLGWADRHSRLRVRANADTGKDAMRARELGAVGIGLCRTEHMFFQPDALRAIRRMILADDPRARQRALHDILPLQRAMFREIFEAMEGLPVTIRLLDPPLHEFLPSREADISEVARDLGVRGETLRARLGQLREANPMLGHRGVRVGVTTPEVYRTQVRALFEAACEVARSGREVFPEVMIPLVGLASELARMRALVVAAAEKVIDEYGTPLDYRIGTMIEVPRAALVAGEIAEHADFFSFGTNDLTQLVYGMSRDDLGRFIADYQREGLLRHSPLAAFDVDGVGRLVRIATEEGRAAQPRLGVGVCGEHGGEPAGVGFFHQVGLDYVSCSPYRVPVARLAAAHAALGLL